MDKINNAIEFYTIKLNRKEKELFKLSDRIAVGDSLTYIEMEKRNILIAETSLIKGFIDELEEIKK